MRTVLIKIRAVISDGAIGDADRFGRCILNETLHFASDAKTEQISLESSGFSGPIEFECDLTQPTTPADGKPHEP